MVGTTTAGGGRREDEPAAAADASARLAAPARVLVAEQDERVRALIVRALQREGFVVDEARDGIAALQAYATAKPDIALVDLGLPGVSGVDVVRRLRQSAHDAALPVLVLGDRAAPEDRIAAFENGADDFISKPIYLPELLRRVHVFERTRRAYAEARDANERAERLRLFAAEAAALLAHDLNNGLTVATATLAGLELLGVFPSEYREEADALSQALHRMAGLVRNFVDISYLEENALVARRSDVAVCELLRAAASIHRVEAVSRQAEIAVECPPGLLARIDPVLVERIIHNLVGNAVRYVGQGGRIAVRARRQDDSAMILDVANTGKPIPEAVRPALFAKYRTGGDRNSRRGMGLYFCKLACEAHGGAIDLIDEPGWDTCFRVRLPW